MSFRFIHTADVHLDSPLVGLSAYGDEAADVVRQASRVALVALVDLALDREVDFMVVAGDLFDGSWPDAGTGHFFTQQMVRLQRQDIPAYVLRGNHDAQSKFTKSLNWPDNVHTFKSNKPHTFAVKGLDVALHGQSFATPAVTDNIAIDYPAAVPGHYNIGVLHTALEGNAQHAPYAPCTLGQLQAFGYDYWALGHVHEYSCLSTAPHVVYPGNLQGRNIRETGPKGAVLVDVAENATTLEQVFVDTVR
ncbi:MAG: exonuclease SbcD, partial [Gammaproteobacteria bacterium]